jgi:ABC-type uncharacterized transport system YnjBCD ATPase subunit
MASNNRLYIYFRDWGERRLFIRFANLLDGMDDYVLFIRDSLVGGQRARISLARAVYSRSQVSVLFDNYYQGDPF